MSARPVVITGASSGIGRCTALDLDARGFRARSLDVSPDLLTAGLKVQLAHIVFSQGVVVTASMPELLTEDRIEADEVLVGGTMDLGEALRGRGGAGFRGSR